MSCCPLPTVPTQPRLHKHQKTGPQATSPTWGDGLLIAAYLGGCSVDIFTAVAKEVFNTESSVLTQTKWNLYNPDSSLVAFGGDDSDVLPPAGDTKYQHGKSEIA